MTIDQLRGVCKVDPFRPFVIHLADGRNVAEFMFIPPEGRTVVVWQPDETLHIIDLLLVTDLEIKPSTNGGRRRR